MNAMDAKEQEFSRRLRETFRIEAEEHLRGLSTGLLELERSSEPARSDEIVEAIFREVHSLKGAARSVDLREVEAVCQPLEGALAALKRHAITPSPALFDLFHQAMDALTRLVCHPDSPRTSLDRSNLRDLNRRLGDAVSIGSQLESREPPPPVADVTNEMPPTAPAGPPAKTGPGSANRPAGQARRGSVAERTTVGPALAPAETVRIPISKLDPLLLQAEEMTQAKLSGVQRAAELREIQEELFSWKTDWAKWRVQRVSQPQESGQALAARLETLTEQVAAVSMAFEQDQRALRHMVDDHLDAMKQVLMLPVTTLVELLPRLVRDLARDQGKEVDLVVHGADVEIDKRILEELKDPLIHLLRNCVDHGIEQPEERVRRGKAERGTIAVSFSAIDNHEVEILVHDDGAGVAAEKVRAAALRIGLITDDMVAQMSRQEILQLVFQSGVSTSEIITDISGRGLGLSIVREKTEGLGGMVTVDSNAGEGTTFRMLLPLTLATFRGVLVSAGGQIFVVPTTHIERALRVDEATIRTVGNRETIRSNGDILSLVKLSDLLGLPNRMNQNGRGGDPRRQSSRVKLAAYGQAVATDRMSVLILSLADKRLAIQVDAVLAEEAVLVKGLGSQLRRVRNIAGATILGSGTIVPVLNVSDLMSSAAHAPAPAVTPTVVEETPGRTGRLLVAEDSITARTLLKNILEAAGYEVTTAVDGVDAFTQLRSGEFELLVSDVDMPRMSGFELTAKIRADQKLSELPVVLVTALDSREDRERGIDVGANAYIVKSSFDQSNLLDVIRRLL